MHEEWVDQALNSLFSSASTEVNLAQIVNGKDLTPLFQGSLSFSHNYDVLDTLEVQEIVAEFFQWIEDFLDLWEEIGFSERVSIEGQLTRLMESLATHNYGIFAGPDPLPTDQAGNKLENWKSFIVCIRKNDNSEIKAYKQSAKLKLRNVMTFIVGPILEFMDIKKG